MAEVVYSLCFLTSAIVAVLLLRGYRRSRARLLMWCALGFAGLCLNNLILAIDLIILPDINLAPYRVMPAIAGMILMVFGLIWEGSK